MVPVKSKTAISLMALFALSAMAAAGTRPAIAEDPAIRNWSAPSTFTPPRSSRARPLSTQGGELTGGPLPFFPVAPCRRYDSRPAHGGAGALLQGVPQTIAISGAPCGIPAGTVAASVNITVFDITAATGNGVFKIDTVSPPATAWINYPPSETQRANGGAVALNNSSQLVVAIAQGGGSVDFTIDVNGYYYNGFAYTMPDQDFFAIRGVQDAGGVVYAANSSSVTGSTGLNSLATSGTGKVFGVTGTASSSTSGAAGVEGLELTGAAGTSGVLGINGTTLFVGASPISSSGVVGINSLSGVLGLGQDRGVAGELFDTVTTGTVLAEGWLGKSGPSGSVYYGVEGAITGTNATAGAAAVLGTDNTGDPGIGAISTTCGVMGRSASGFGVAGVSRNAGVAVYGASVNTIGGTASAGYLGFSNTIAIVGMGDLSITGTKSFVDPHPTDASKVIAYVALEGPEAGIYFRGRGRFERGTATIEVPENFRMVGDEEGMTVQVTPIGKMANVAVLSADLNQIVVQASADVEFYYTVNGLRKAFKDYTPVQENVYFGRQGGGEKMPTALAPEQKARLIANGTYNEDGTVNLETAKKLGWDKVWASRGAAAAGPGAAEPKTN